MQTKGLDCAKQLPHCVQLDKAANQIGMLANTDDTPQAEPLPLDRIAAGQASLTRDQIAEGPGVNDEIAKPSSNSTPAPSAATDVGTQQHQHTAASDVVRAAPPVALRQVSVAQAVADAAIATAALSVSVSDTEGNGGFSQQLNAQQSLNKSSSQSCQQFGVQSSLDVAPSMSPHASRAAETAGTSQQLAPQQSFSTAAANAAQQLIHQSSQPKAPPENSNVHSRTSSLASPWLLQQALDATVNLAEEGQHLLQYTEGKPFAAPRPLDVTEADEEIAATAGAAAASTHAVPATAQAVSTVAAPAVTEAALAYTAAAVATDPSSDEKGDTAPADAGLITQTKAAASDSPTFSVPRRHDASLEQMLEGPGSIADDADASVAVLPDGMPPAASHLPMHHELAANSPAHSVHSTSVNTDAASLDPMPTATSLSPTNSQGPAHFPSHDPESTADHTDCSSESVPILRSAYTPPPPQDSKHRFSGPRRSAAFRHSISGNDQSRQLATSLAAWPNPDSHRESQSMQVRIFLLIHLLESLVL